MKKLVCLLLVTMLTGCGGREAVFETIGEQAYEAVSAPEPGVISVWMPDDAALQTADAAAREIYVWDRFELRLETLPGGDLDATLAALTGQSPDALTVMGYEAEGMQRYQTVWSAVGEEDVTLGRCMVADDGNYHYCVTLLSPEEPDSSELYAELCASFTVAQRDGGK